MHGQPPARGSNPAREGFSSGPRKPLIYMIFIPLGLEFRKLKKESQKENTENC